MKNTIFKTLFISAFLCSLFLALNIKNKKGLPDIFKLKPGENPGSWDEFYITRVIFEDHLGENFVDGIAMIRAQNILDPQKAKVIDRMGYLYNGIVLEFKDPPKGLITKYAYFSKEKNQNLVVLSYANFYNLNKSIMFNIVENKSKCLQAKFMTNDGNIATVKIYFPLEENGAKIITKEQGNSLVEAINKNANEKGNLVLQAKTKILENLKLLSKPDDSIKITNTIEKYFDDLNKYTSNVSKVEEARNSFRAKKMSQIITMFDKIYPKVGKKTK